MKCSGFPKGLEGRLVDGVQRRAKSPCEWLGGDTLTWDGSWEGARRPFPKRDQTADVWLAHEGSMPECATAERGCKGDRALAALPAKRRVLHAPLAYVPYVHIRSVIRRDGISFGFYFKAHRIHP